MGNPILIPYRYAIEKTGRKQKPRPTVALHPQQRDGSGLHRVLQGTERPNLSRGRAGTQRDNHQNKIEPMDDKLRTRAEVKEMLRAINTAITDEDILDALTTVSLTDEERRADLKERNPHLSDDEITALANEQEAQCNEIIGKHIETLNRQARILIEANRALYGDGKGLYRVERDGSTVTIWDDKEGIGLQFKEGETLQRYNGSIVMKDPSILETENGVEHVKVISRLLNEYAAELFPFEFKPIKTEQEGRYRVERTQKEVQALGLDGKASTGVTDVTIVWDDVEGIGLELPPYGDIVADPKRGDNPFTTAEGRQHAKDVAKGIENYIKQNGIV